MDALTTLAPVFVMLILGYIARVKQWITKKQKEGANAIIFNILFPILVFQLICNATLEIEHIKIILYVFVAYMLAYILGKVYVSKVEKEYSHFAHYLLTVVEGGNVGLPLYLSIVGSSSNTVIFDIAGSIAAFIVFPIMVAKQSSTSTTKKELIKSILTNSFVIAVILGLFLNLTGIYQMLLESSFGEMITSVFTEITSPIVPIILFILGYDLQVNKDILKPLSKLISFKFIYYVLVIVGFFILFPNLMADKVFMMAPIIYFMAPTGFGLMPVIAPLYKNDSDSAFTSAFVSIYIIITLIVYTLVVLLIA